MWLPLPAKLGINFADKRRSFGRIVRSRSQATEFLVFRGPLLGFGPRDPMNDYATRRSQTKYICTLLNQPLQQVFHKMGKLVTFLIERATIYFLCLSSQT
jgi:hypothetical protein